ncbi:hypothetical protein BS50DRAFT_593066 [Corynespora cassiicola Philippines]|uniref:Integral membrane protein n=1 Tax=Corynespora cassiicola Philippines TaxID=1448308 RepID=A0A2T2N6R5_CORCC|nr:hypothetical protein BS50DRAFT_593066 [Corynespora cassiicola Philippines]
MRFARPPATAYALGLLSSTGPRLLRLLLLLAKGKLTVRAAWLQFITVLRQALALHRFPAFCGVLVGGSTLLKLPLSALIISIQRLARSASTPLDVKAARLIATFLAALVSASVSFRLLNSAPPKLPSLARARAPSYPRSHLDVVEPGPFDDPPEPSPLEVDDATLASKSLSRVDLAGRTMDLTLFSAVRALDVLINSAWHTLPIARSSRGSRVSRSAPTALFCFSAATIMHAWFYSPSRLPQAYNTWISAAAELDQRLLLALRHARYGTWVYGKDTGMAPLLGSLCRDYGLAEHLGDPAKTIPVPCELVHMGAGKSCEKHALSRFWRGWLFAAKMYTPLQLIVLARHLKSKARPGNRLAGLTRGILLKTFADMARSSAFLGSFIAFFYYGVCLSRTRLGPKVFSYKTVTPQMWDSGLCVLAGCLLCGMSILVEQSRKRLEIMLFVLPRATATWFPRRYLPENRWKEHLAFTLSAAIVLTSAQENPQLVRGFLGSLLHRILNMD